LKEKKKVVNDKDNIKRRMRRKEEKANEKECKKGRREK
jgi:hypothetical protein